MSYYARDTCNTITGSICRNTFILFYTENDSEKKPQLYSGWVCCLVMSHMSFSDETWHSCIFPKEDPEINHVTHHLGFADINIMIILIMSAKLATLGLLKIKVF